ncbi:HAD superfamily hydrolase (TIGR01509 family)/beta-phosphoglucomutase family hydrolase [Ornithinimicrobium humiphilum]|uniref:HAD superfamily hydrolase (TIGR01509 family)/beta-phosphoglucomutase family hydrolase n=1 Tax=Ornithinimicrobium humiphilum TaxID=125288 RepID=A0A543KMJ9_9MICO|nr:HAD-IA family hydrolase [Ornithinimicrobium humiphilum]TQM96302.1 HAD superfamily hydrolase (TIGR01509 family)/beta-phosphoglucomutase family hydrolase [Ornithinimicrobium humiphilum]
MEWVDVDAVLFDLDGVLTPTAEVHMRAWKELFTSVLESLPDDSGADRSPYTDQDYFRHVDGRPRYEGVEAFLRSRGIDLPHGTPDDPPEAQTVCGLGNRKNVVFNELLDAEGIEAYPGSVRVLDDLAGRGTEVAVVTSSRNGPHVLRTSGLADRFEVVVDGGVAAEKGLRGKPEPDTYAYAAELLGVPVERCAVVEDAESGVRAGAAGGFGLVVGVDRGVGADVLREAGADVVVTDLAELLDGQTG